MSACRSPPTNNAFNNRTGRAAKKSYHMLGKAIDFRMDGVNLATVREAALSLQSGGVGYYPQSNFVHIDTGPVRAW